MLASPTFTNLTFTESFHIWHPAINDILINSFLGKQNVRSVKIVKAARHVLSNEVVKAKHNELKSGTNSSPGDCHDALLYIQQVVIRYICIYIKGLVS